MANQEASGHTAGSAGAYQPFTASIKEGEPFRLYLVSNPTVLPELDLEPFGIHIEPIDFCAENFAFRQAEYEVAQLLALFRLAHAMSSPDAKLVLPRWVIVDLVLMSSAVLLALAGQEHVESLAHRLEHDAAEPDYAYRREHAAKLRDLLRLASDRGYTGPLPVAGYAAIPTPTPHCWVGGTLWWSLVPGRKLGCSIRRIALKCYKAEKEVGVTQFDNAPALQAQKYFGRLRVTHTSLAVHPVPHTFVYEVDLTTLPPDGGLASATGESQWAHALDPSDPRPPAELDRIELDRIQAEIDSGVAYYVSPGDRREPGTGPRIYKDGNGPAMPAEPGHQAGLSTDPNQTAEPPAEPSHPAEPPAEPSHPAEPAAPSHPAARAAAENAADFFTPGIRTGDPYMPYLLSNSSVLADLERAPFGIPLKSIDICDRYFSIGDDVYEVSKLVELFSRANALSYAESGLGTPKRVMVELALMPSAVLLVLAPQDHLREVARQLSEEPVTDLRSKRLIPLAEDDRDRLRNANSLRELLVAASDLHYTGPLPIAGYAAVPTPRCGHWVGWSLWSLVPGVKLGYTVKRLAVACYRVRTQAAVIQFHMARGLDIIAKFGMLRLTNVYVRAHPAPHAFGYEIDLSGLPGDGSPVPTAAMPKATLELDPDSAQLTDALKKMQRGIDQGRIYYVLSRPVGRTRSPIIPIYRRSPIHRMILAGGRSLVRNSRAKQAARHRRAAALP